MHEKTEQRPLPRLLVTLAALMLIAAACGSSGTAESDTTSKASTATDDEPGISLGANKDPAGDGDTETEAETEPVATTAPIATAVPNEVPEPTATPVPTPTPEPLNVLTLADAKAGVSGVNWTIHFTGTEHWEPFGQPTGEEADRLDIHPWMLDSVRDLLVVTGSPQDEWVEVLLPWLEPNGQTGWVRTASGELFSTDVVLEIQRSAGVLSVWSDGEIIWSADDLSEPERRLAHVPLVIGSIAGMAEQGTREFFSPSILGLSVTLVDVEGIDFQPVLGIRGLNDGASVEDARASLPPDAKGSSIWIRSSELEELAELLPAGARVELVE